MPEQLSNCILHGVIANHHPLSVKPTFTLEIVTNRYRRPYIIKKISLLPQPFAYLYILAHGLDPLDEASLQVSTEVGIVWDVKTL
jgi:hypothetical protein